MNKKLWDVHYELDIFVFKDTSCDHCSHVLDEWIVKRLQGLLKFLISFENNFRSVCSEQFNPGKNCGNVACIDLTD